MKMLGKFKLMAISACVVVGMSSCLKTSDPDFSITNGSWYVLQRNSVSVTNADTTPSFAPYMAFRANEALAKVSVTSTSFPLGVSGKINGEVWESNISIYEYVSDMAEESYTITANNAEGKIATYPFKLGVNKEKAIGVLTSEFSYDAAKGLTVKWTPAKNANYYELYIWDDSLDNGNKVLIGRATTNVTELTFTNNDAAAIRVENGKSYGFELVAYYAEDGVVKTKLVPLQDDEHTVPSWNK